MARERSVRRDRFHVHPTPSDVAEQRSNPEPTEQHDRARGDSREPDTSGNGRRWRSVVLFKLVCAIVRERDNGRPRFGNGDRKRPRGAHVQRRRVLLCRDRRHRRRVLRLAVHFPLGAGCPGAAGSRAAGLGTIGRYARPEDRLRRRRGRRKPHREQDLRKPRIPLFRHGVSLDL